MLTAGEQPNAVETSSREGNQSSEQEFRCPGEAAAISRALHLSRLSAGFPACRECPSRHTTSSLPEHVIRRIDRAPSADPGGLLHQEGLRGRYLNQFTPESIGRVVAHALNVAESAREGDSSVPMRVLFGRDGRESSPELATAAVAVLRRNGCEITDVGRVTRPEFDFAAARRRPELGILLTGGTLPDIWTGLDLQDEDGIPWCSPGRLDELVARLPETPSRLGRNPGRYQPWSVTADYRRWVGSRFHALRPFRLVVACEEEMVLGLLRAVTMETPCSMHLMRQANAARISDTVRERHADMGFLISRDGRGCRLFDELGEPVAPADLIRLLGDDEPFDRSAVPAVKATQSAAVTPLTTSLKSTGQATPNLPAENAMRSIESRPTGMMMPHDTTEAETVAYQERERIPIVADEAGRVRFRGEPVACDALQTLAETLQSLSRSDRTVSRRIAPGDATLGNVVLQ